MTTFYLSGGAYNTSPDLSLGGSPSSTLLFTTTNNLFHKVTRNEIRRGGITYRCFYIFNETLSTMEDVEISIDQEGDLATIGVLKATEVQRIILGGDPIGGSFILRYTVNIDGIPMVQETNSIPFNPNPTIMASNIQDAINSLDYLDEVVVTTTRQDDHWIYSVTFSGIHNNKDHQLLEIVSNNILGDDISLVTQIVTEGQPINGIANNIGSENIGPFGVEFTDESIVIGDLAPFDGFAVWVRREIEAGATDDLYEITFSLSFSD